MAYDIYSQAPVYDGEGVRPQSDAEIEIELRNAARNGDLVVSKRNAITGRISLSAGSLSQIDTTSRVSVGAIGDSISRNNYTNTASGGSIGAVRTWTAFGAWLALAAYLTDGLCIPDVYAVEGYSGQRTDEILTSALSNTATEAWGVASTIPVGVRARPQQIVVDMSGTNDQTYYESLSDANGISKTVAGRRAIWNYIRATGARPVALSLLPRNSPALYGNRTAAYNAAIADAAAQDGVPFADAYRLCANADGTWRTGFTYKAGSDDAIGLHPSWLATQQIAIALAPALRSLIGSAPIVPRVVPGNSALYSVAFKTGPGDYFKQFVDGAFPSLSGTTSRYDPQADSTFALVTPSIDPSGGGTVEFRKPTNSGGGYADWTMTPVAVVAGQEYWFFADVEVDKADAFAAFSIGISDNSYQPMAAWALSKDHPSGASQKRFRLSLYYKVPTGVTVARPIITVNISAGGVAGSLNRIRMANVAHVRVA